MSEKQSKIKGALEVFAKSIVQPLMYLSVAGILLIVGIVLTNSTVTAALPFLQSGPFQFSDVGGTLVLGETVVAGAYPIRVAEMAMEGMPFSDSTYFNSYTFNNLWPYIGIGLAFITTAYKQNRKKTEAVMIPLIVTAVLSCITEPMDFLFVFAAPILFVIHSILSGVFLVLLKVLSIPAGTSGGIINILVSNLVLGVDKTNWPMMFVLGIANAAIFDLIAGLGGKDNIEALENCFTRLRVMVKDASLINEDLINHVPNSGINRNGTDIQIIYGMQVAAMRDKVENALETL